MKTRLLVTLLLLHTATGQDATNSTTFFPTTSPALLPAVTMIPTGPSNYTTVPPLNSLPPVSSNITTYTDPPLLTTTASPSAPPAPPPATSLPSMSPVVPPPPPPAFTNATIAGITIQFANVPPLSDETALWENVTSAFFTQFYRNNDAGIRNFTTTITLNSQDSVLRNGVISTTFNYTQFLKYIAQNGTTVETLGYYAVYPLNTVEGNSQYVAALIATLPGWENLNTPIAVPLLPGQTRAPTTAPSAVPTVSLMPTVPLNTSEPTTSPTRVSTENPSTVPSQLPSEGAASDAPSTTPTTITSSLAPSSAKVLPIELVEIDLFSIELSLKGGGALEDDEIELWQQVTAQWFTNFFSSGSDSRRRLQASKIDTMMTEFTFVRQEADNTIIYHQYMEYSTTEENDDDPESVAVQPFNDDDANTEYGTILQNEFANMKGLKLPLQAPVIPNQDKLPPDEEEKEDDDGNMFSMGVLIGIIAAGAAVLLVCAYVGYSAMKGSSRDGDDERRRDHESEASPQLFHITSDEDMSTIMDDPYTSQKQKAFENKILDVGYGDQSVATVDYDYSKAYGGGDTSVVSSAGGTMGDTTRLTSGTANTAALAALGAERDNGGHEQVLVIIAPAGKLGVVIDTPDDGAPVVHAVKDTSVIADQIQVGDKLVAVDDDDVRSMTAIRVSKLISKKSNNPSRKLTIVRRIIME